MRMRRKRHLDERIQGRASLLFVEGNGFYLQSEEERRHYYDWRSVFGNDNPVEIEIGCGKGGFIAELAKANKDVNYIAVEKITNVLITAIEKIEREGIENVRFLNVDAMNLGYFIGSPVARAIYLNFSTPYPKGGSAGKRLTNPRYLDVFAGLLCEDGVIKLKTDSRVLFEYSLCTLSHGFTLEKVSLDLHSSYYAEQNVMTEYERGFVEKGLPIYMLEAKKR